ncbi:MAG: hypothetical protein F9B45_20710 [Phycisphaera sp. RhM]|nr:hypothetical protein [Phycisphaera sp. RhM]
MNGLIWQLPGVQSFVQRVTENLDSGTNVILHCPPNAPDGLVDAIRILCMRDYPQLQWLSVDTSRWSHSTSVSIAHNLSLVDVGVAAGVTSAEELASHGQQRVYAVENLSQQCWPQFTKFLERFRLANHQQDENDRDVFLVNASAAFAVPDFDVGLRAIAWRGIVREIDSRLFIELIASQSKNAGLESAISISIATELGGSDLDLIERLAAKSLEELLDPKSVLLEFARNSAWCSPECRTWCDGGLESFRDRPRIHSSVVALTNDESEIRKRIWHGQLTTVFPYLEERRLDMLPRLKPFLRNFDLRDPQGYPVELEDLEWGSIAHFIQKSAAPTQIADEVRLLRDLRHELAHLRPIKMSLMNRFLRYAERTESSVVGQPIPTKMRPA